MILLAAFYSEMIFRAKPARTVNLLVQKLVEASPI
jgi:hypothetical protein